MRAQFPEEFAALADFVPFWAGQTAFARAHLRDSAAPAAALAFYNAVQPFVEPALAFLDRKPLAEHDEGERHLMRLSLSFAHVAMAIEVQREDEAEHAKLRQYMRITQAPADAS
jgi:hypothetical protein